MEYRDILEKQKEGMRNDLRWWPDFLYHFTDVHNASRILYDGWIFSRQQATEKAVMMNDNASRAVIEATDADRMLWETLFQTAYSYAIS